MENNLKKRVMWRIYVLFTKDVIFEHKGYFILSALVVYSFIFVSIKDVMVNTPKDDLTHTFNYLMVALRDTEWIMQAMLAGAVIWIGVAISKSIYKNLQKFRKHSLLAKI